MVKVGVVGLGKMGLSHLAILGADPEANVVGACDSTAYLLEVLRKNTSFSLFSNYQKMLAETSPDAVVIATPNVLHFEMAKYALERGIHVFCEKPLTLDPEQSETLNELAKARGLVTQVGYHNRFVGSFAEVKRLLGEGAIGKVSHVLAEAYGPVVLRPKGSTWRNQRTQGGGCLYDYAAHPLDLIEWYFGEAQRVRGSELRSIFSAETEDEVLTTLSLADDVTAQVSVNWSDESFRKMTTRLTIWGEHGKIYADRQEIQVYLRSTATIPEGYLEGQNVKYTTELTPEVDFYLRGEEYSSELAHFVASVAVSMRGESPVVISDFASAAGTDRVIARIIADAQDLGSGVGELPAGRVPTAPGPSTWRRIMRRRSEPLSATTRGRR